MLGMSKKTDYALLALSYLARRGAGRSVRTREIAEQFDIPIELLAKILQQLTRAGMLASTPGPTGGYYLTHSADAITVGQVIAAIEGRPALIQCMKTDHTDCEQLNKCTIRRPLERINARVFQMLNRISLQEINDPEPAPASALNGPDTMALMVMHGQTADAPSEEGTRLVRAASITRMARRPR